MAIQADQKLEELKHLPLGRLLYRYSMPAVVGMAAMSIYQLVDAYYVGRWCGPYAIAGLAIVFPVINLMIAIGILTGTGAAANISIALGKGDKNLAFRIFGHGLLLPLIFNSITASILYCHLPEVLILFGASKETFEPAYQFMSISVLTFPLTALFMNINHMTRASGYPKKAMRTLLISVGANIIIAPILIRYFDMGIAGAALATCIAQFIGLLCIAPHLFNRKNVIYLRRGIFKLSSTLIKRICLVGLPPCLVNISACVIVAIYNHLFLEYQGDLGVASFGIVNRFAFIFVMVVMGISQGLQPIVGFNYGIGYYDRVHGALFRAMTVGASVTTIGFLFAQLMPRSIMGLFVKASDPLASQIIESGASGMRIFLIIFPIIGAQIIIGNFFQSIGKPTTSIILNTLRQVIILIPCLFILPKWIGVDGIWWAAACSDLIAAIACWTALFLYLSNHKKTDVSSSRYHQI